MRKDAAYEDGVRPQCLSCKRRRDAEYRNKGKIESRKAARKAARMAANEKRKAKELNKKDPRDMLFECSLCERTDVRYEDMEKDKNRFNGVTNRCLACRRLKERKKREGVPEGYSRCVHCKKPHSTKLLMKPPPSVSESLPKDALVCKGCLGSIETQDTVIHAERVKRGLTKNATRKEVESVARVTALKILIANHDAEYKRLFEHQLKVLGLSPRREWVTL